MNYMHTMHQYSINTASIQRQYSVNTASIQHQYSINTASIYSIIAGTVQSAVIIGYSGYA
jgi:hypothetical protein